MRFRVLAAVLSAAAIALPVAATAPADAARCVSGAEVRNQVSRFVRDLRDDVTSRAARDAVRGAFVESVRAARGVKARTPKERKGLGEQISALAGQLADAETRVERTALIAEIHALQEQKRADRVTRRDLARLRADVTGVRRALVAAVDTEAEGRQVAAFAHELMAQFTC